ncbi:MAG TPA: alpha/beta hydrolase [Thermoleophilaceae bacterium]|jgi:pimeloyl-ACP methyl ester carboxylesterase
MPVVEANGQRLYYESAGEGEPLLMVMGLGADHLAWAFQVGPLSEQFQVITFDNRDCGQSSYADGPYEITDMAADAIGLADALGIDTFHLVGASMGGAIAQEIALGWPERVRTLTLAITFGGAGAYGRKLGRMLAADVVRRSFEEQIDQMMLLCFTEELYDQTEKVTFLRQGMLANPHPQQPEGFARQAEASGRHEARERLPSLKMPVHVIGAERDILVPVWKSQELAELIPGAKLTIIEGAAHGLNLERAEDFNAAVLDFLRSEQPSPA